MRIDYWVKRLLIHKQSFYLEGTFRNYVLRLISQLDGIWASWKGKECWYHVGELYANHVGRPLETPHSLNSANLHYSLYDPCLYVTIALIKY